MTRIQRMENNKNARELKRQETAKRQENIDRIVLESHQHWKRGRSNEMDQKEGENSFQFDSENNSQIPDPDTEEFEEEMN